MILSDKFKNKYRIPSTRLSCHDYNDGVYFITICTKNREYYFGEISNDEMHLSEIGQYAEKSMKMIEELHQDTNIPLFQIMPNHIHLIIIVETPWDRQETPYYDVSTMKTGGRAEPKDMRGIANNCGRLSHIISGFKSAVTKFAKEQDAPFAWQPRFYDRIIRNDDELNLITEYIRNNVANWKEDDLNSRRDAI